jgi:hypothetical protein
MGGSDEQPANNVEITRIVRNMFFFIKILFIERIKPLILLDQHHYPMMRYGFGMGKRRKGWEKLGRENPPPVQPEAGSISINLSYADNPFFTRRIYKTEPGNPNCVGRGLLLTVKFYVFMNGFAEL